MRFIFISCFNDLFKFFFKFFIYISLINQNVIDCLYLMIFWNFFQIRNFLLLKLVISLKYFICFLEWPLNFFFYRLIIESQRIFLHFFILCFNPKRAGIINVPITTTCITLFDLRNRWVHKIWHIFWWSICKDRLWVWILSSLFVHLNIPFGRNFRYWPIQRIFIHYFLWIVSFDTLLAFETFLRIYTHSSLQFTETLFADTTTWAIA